MGARGRIIGLALCMAVLESGIAMAQNTAGAENGGQAIIEGQDRRIEQVYVNMPKVYVYGTGFTQDDVRQGAGYLSQEKLNLIDASAFSNSAEGICYYVLLDISGSVPGTYFQAIKEGIQSLQDSLGARDTLVLCTFGEDVVLAADGGQTSDELAAILAGLKNKDQKTLLFEGIDRVAALSEQRKAEDYHRSVLAVISDGEDISVGRKLAQEAQNTLKEKGIPVYAFCIKDTATANINNFGEFARMSGGDLVTFTSEDAGQMLCRLAEDLKNDIRMEYRSDTNVVTNKEEQFSLKFADGSVLTRSMMNVHWIPDTEAPYLVSGEAVGSQQIRLRFSEPVAGLEGAANYQVTLEGEPVGVTGVSVDKGDSTVASLSLSEPVKNGTYEIACTNITDCSMEKNPVAGSMKVTIDNVPEQAADLPEPEAFDYTGVLFLIFVAVVALVVTLLVRSRKKADKPSEDRQERQSVLLGGKGFEQHVKIPAKAEKIRLEVVISMNGTQPRETVWELGTSLIVGRSSQCDVFFDDPEMSRQHFSLEAENGGIYIADLDSTNGTAVNGIGIHGKRRLNPGASIEAGSMKIIVRW